MSNISQGRLPSHSPRKHGYSHAYCVQIGGNNGKINLTGLSHSVTIGLKEVAASRGSLKENVWAFRQDKKSGCNNAVAIRKGFTVFCVRNEFPCLLISQTLVCQVHWYHTAVLKSSFQGSHKAPTLTHTLVPIISMLQCV